MFEKDFEQFMKSMGFNSHIDCDCSTRQYGCECGTGCECDMESSKPKVYGIHMEIGPDGIPHIQEFGNMKNGLMSKYKDWQKQMGIGMKQKPRSTVEVIENATEDGGKIIVEMPGLDKDDIRITVRDSKMFISASKEKTSTDEHVQRTYNEKIVLPLHVDSKTIKATYTNGILEVTFKYSQDVESRNIPISG